MRIQTDTRYIYYSLILTIAVVYLVPFSLTLSKDEEEFRFNIISTIIHWKGLANGEYPFWTSLLGFGIPLPLGQNLIFHPVAPLFGFVKGGVAIMAIYFVQTILGVFSMWALLNTLKVSRAVALLGVISYLCASPTINYLYTDFWTSYYVMWTTYPILVYITLRILEEESKRNILKLTLAGGLIGGLFVLNGHIGVMPIYFIGLLFILIGKYRLSAHRYGWYLLIFLIIVTISLSKIYGIYSEYILFPKTSDRNNIIHVIDSKEIWAIFIRPIIWGSFQEMLDYTLATKARIISFGGPFAILAIVGASYNLNKYPNRKVLAFAFFASFLGLYMPTDTVITKFISWSFSFREPLIIFGICLACMVATSITQSKKKSIKLLGGAICGAQLILVTMGAYPFWHHLTMLGLYNKQQKQDMLINVFDDTSMVRLLKKINKSDPGRFYLSKELDNSILKLKKDGVSLNSLLYHGLHVVNGDIKSVSYDKFYPDLSLMHGHIAGQNSVVIDNDLLNVLGIKYVLAYEDEKVSSDLVKINQISLPRLNKIYIYKNSAVWPEAVVLAPGIKNATLPRKISCENNRILCADFSRIANGRESGIADISKKRNGYISVTLGEHAKSTLVMVTEMYRDKWRARAIVDGRIESIKTFPIAESFIGFEAPPGASHIYLKYEPNIMIWLTILSWSIILFVTFTLVALKGQSE